MAEPVRVEAVAIGDLTTFVITGELDAATLPALSDRLAQVLAQSPRRLVFDLARVAFIDCAATRLITGSGRFLPDGSRPVLRRPSAAVRRVLDLTGLAVGCEVED